MDAERLDAIRKRAEAATAGPWESRMLGGGKGGPNVYSIRREFADGKIEQIAHTERHHGRSAGADGSFIAHARDDIPALLAEVALLREKAEATGIEPLAEKIAAGWTRYCALFEQPPHGTRVQILALLELCRLDALPPGKAETTEGA